MRDERCGVRGVRCAVRGGGCRVRMNAELRTLKGDGEDEGDSGSEGKGKEEIHKTIYSILTRPWYSIL